MKSNEHNRIAYTLVTCLMVACQHLSAEPKTSIMTMPTPRIELMFKKTKIACFGRFIIDVPETAQLLWGHASNNLGINVYRNNAAAVEELAENFAQNLKSTKAINQNDVPMFLAEEKMEQPRGRIITGYESFESINGMEINGYFTWGSDGFVVSARPLREDMADTVSEIRSIARRLPLRDVAEVPSERGNCLEDSFLPDRSDTDAAPPVEHVRFGIRLKEFPDTHLSIYIGPSNPHYSEGNSLEWQLARLEERQKAEDPNHPLLKTKYFRRGERQIHEWLNGWEVVSRSPDRSGQHGTHEFVMHVRGVPKDVFKPYANIQMQTGLEGNTPGAVKPSLTDEEAIAVWDKITSSIRVRPTSAAPAKTGTAPRLPLGEKVATGNACPLGGWWESSAPGLLQAGRRQRFKTGDAMPPVVVAATPTLWQKIKGERPTFQVEGVWKLVGYDDEPAALQASSAQGAAVSPADRGAGA